MGQFFETIPPSQISWALNQHLFWVASAPLSATGHVNVSPKGGRYFGIPSPTQFWYIDLTGSGIETISHLREPGNGRITILFSAFEGAPRILRFWGKGRTLEFGTPEFESYVAEHGIKTIDGTRSIIIVDIHQVGTSCGFSVPFFDFKEYRSTLNDFFEKRCKSEREGNAKDGIERYWAHKNAWSMDEMPGMRRGLATAEKEAVQPIKKMVGVMAPKRAVGGERVWVLWQVLLVAFWSGVVGAFMARQMMKC